MIEILLSKTGKYAGKFVVVIDDCDKDLADFDWQALDGRRGTWYATRTIKNAEGKRVHQMLHRVVMERMIAPQKLLKTELVDHINGNGLDNRRKNLRVATNQQNSANRRVNKNNTSGYRGVSWDKSRQKWRAQIRENSKKTNLGCFTTPEEAYQAYCDKAKELRGEFVNLGDS